MRNLDLTRSVRGKMRSAKNGRARVKVSSRRRRPLLETLESRALLAGDLLSSVELGGFCHELMQEAEVLVPTNSENSDALGPQEFLRASESNSESSGSSETSLPAEVINSFVYYDGTMFSQVGMAEATDTVKQLVKEAAVPQPLTFNNLLNNDGGITGVVFEIANLATDQLQLTDFQFQVSPTGDFDQQQHPPTQWDVASDPAEIVVGTTLDPETSQVTLRWNKSDIENRWLRITVLANENTGLLTSEVYYIGHLEGKVVDGIQQDGRLSNVTFFEVNGRDTSAVRLGVGVNTTAENSLDINKDGVVSFADVFAVRSAYGNRLSNITIPPTPVASPQFENPKLDLGGSAEQKDSDSLSDAENLNEDGYRDDLTESNDSKGSENDDHFDDSSAPLIVHIESPASVVDSFVYYRNSSFDGAGIMAALDHYKQLARESFEPQTLGVDNLINSSRGINGLVFNILNLPADSLENSDFHVQVSPTGVFNELASTPKSWELAPDPENIVVVKDEQSGISQVNVQWPDDSIVNRWLRITIHANENTGLEEPAVYYIGHLHGKSTNWLINYGGWNPSGVYEVHSVDLLAIRAEVGQNVEAGNVFDINKDGVISFQDIMAMRDSVGTMLSNVTVVASGGENGAPMMSSPLDSASNQLTLEGRSTMEELDEAITASHVDSVTVLDEGAIVQTQTGETANAEAGFGMESPLEAAIVDLSVMELTTELLPENLLG